MRLLLLLSLVFSQQQVTDTNFYGAIYKGMHLVRFTAEWSQDSKQNFYQGKFIVDGDSAHMGTQMMIIPSKKVPKDGKKVKVWKADFDGKLELTTDDVKKAIDWHSR